MGEYTVLIIEDHPLICEAYKSACKNASDSKISFNIDVVNNSVNAVKKINDAVKEKTPYDLIFLDLRLPKSEKDQIYTGEDLGIRIREMLPTSKIIISTTFNDNYRIHSIIKTVNPEGFLIKNDIVPQELVGAIRTVIKEPPYYSKTVLKLLRKQITVDFTVDNIDRTILHELSLGTKMKDLPQILNLSIAGIEKRKRHLKDIFNVNNESDKELIAVAKEKGFI